MEKKEERGKWGGKGECMKDIEEGGTRGEREGKATLEVMREDQCSFKDNDEDVFTCLDSQN